MPESRGFRLALLALAHGAILLSNGSPAGVSDSPSLTIVSPGAHEHFEVGNAIPFVIEVVGANTLPATVSLRAQIDGVSTHSWDLDAILSVDGIVTVILEHVGRGRHTLVAEMQHAPDQDVAHKVSVTIDVLAKGRAEEADELGDTHDTERSRAHVVTKDEQEDAGSREDAVVGEALEAEGRCFAGGAGAACLGGWDEEGGVVRQRDAVESRREPPTGAFVHIVSPVVSQVYAYVEEAGGSWGALVNVVVKVHNFDVAPGAGTVVVCLNDQPLLRSSHDTVELKIGGLGLGSHVVTATLVDADGHLVRGPPLKEDGQSSVLGMYPETDAPDCYSAFKVDRRVWRSLAGDAEALYRGIYSPRVFDWGQDALISQPRATSEPVHLDLDGVYVWEELVSAYREFHRAALRGAPGAVPVYVYTPRDCGWGNRLIDLASAYQVALLSERLLIVNWTTPVPLWELALSDLEVWPTNPLVGAHLRHMREGGSYLLLDLDSLAGPRSLSQVMSGVTAVEYHVGPVIRMTYDDEAWLHSKAFGLFHPELAIALGQCLKQVIRPSPAVEELVSARLGGNSGAIGVHVRVTMSKKRGAGGDTQIGPSSTIPLRRQGQAMLILTTISALRASPPGTKIVVATDSPAMREVRCIDTFAYVRSRKSFSSHPSLAPHVLASPYNGSIVHSARERGVEAQLMMAADWWTLTRCGQLVLTRQSTFGYIAAGTAGVTPYTVHEHKVERRFHCGPFALCDLYPADSGV